MTCGVSQDAIVTTTQASPTLSILQDLHQPIADELAQAKRRFDDELAGDLPFVDELCDRVRGYRGKMLRPTLLLLTAKACQNITDAHLTLAAVVEMVHVATLVHDDVLDVAHTRRMHRTINATDGNQTAVLLGDYLISHAFHLCSSLSDTWACRRVGAATNTVCQGELMQIHHRGDLGLSQARYLDIIRRKTAALTATCCALGARYAGADDRTVAAWERFGDDLGVAFQIVDDVLDCMGTEAQMGKTLGSDLELGKPTLPIIHALAKANGPIRAELVGVLGGGTGVSRERVGELLTECESIDYAYRIADQFVSSAREHLESVTPGPATDALGQVTDFILLRQQ